MITRAITALLIAAALTAPGSAQPSPVKIDVILSLTGSTSFTGKDQVDALHVLEAYTNKTGGIGGRPMQFVFHDDTSSPQVAVQLANQVIATNAPVMINCTTVLLDYPWRSAFWEKMRSKSVDVFHSASLAEIGLSYRREAFGKLSDELIGVGDLVGHQRS